MTKSLNTCLTLVFIICLFACEIASAIPPFIGVFISKGEDDLDGIRVIFNEDGKGMMTSGPFLWKLGPATNQITLTGSFAGNPQKADSVTVVFDSDKREMRFVSEILYGGNLPLFKGETLYCTTNRSLDIDPHWLHNYLLHFDGTGNSLTHGCIDTIFALSVTNHMEDLRKLEQAIRNQAGFYCQYEPGIAGDKMNLLGVDARDVALVRDFSTNQIVRHSMSVRIRKSDEDDVFEIWENGKKAGEEKYENGKPIPTWMRP